MSSIIAKKRVSFGSEDTIYYDKREAPSRVSSLVIRIDAVKEEKLKAPPIEITRSASSFHSIEDIMLAETIDNTTPLARCGCLWF